MYDIIPVTLKIQQVSVGIKCRKNVTGTTTGVIVGLDDLRDLFQPK